MKIGIIGLGAMGEALVYRMQRDYELVGFDIDEKKRTALRAKELLVVDSLEELARQADVFWLMIPAGDPVDMTIKALQPHLKSGSILVDGGNSKFTNSIRRAEALKKDGIIFLDCGTSGGPRGASIGFCLMIGGDFQAYKKLEALFTVVAVPGGYGYMGPSGSGHYVKMVHNGIEYALMQAYAEGLQLLKEGHFKDLDLAEITKIWANGSVIRSWLLELIHEILLQDQSLKTISGSVAESGMGRWTIEEAQKHDVPTQLIEDALAIRFWSQETGGNYATKIVALLRNKFGGHPVKTIDHE